MRVHREILKIKGDPNGKLEKEDKHPAADESLEPRRCPRFDWAESAARIEAGGAGASDGCGTDANSNHIMALTDRKLI
jgi:hypothetical protein